MEEKETPVLGRPTKYSQEVVDKAKKWVDDYKYFETYQKEVVVKDQIQVINCERPSGIPSIVGLAIYLEVDRETIYNWGRKYPIFFGILERLRVKQEDFLVYHGLTRGYDSTFARFITTNVTDYRDNKEDDTKPEAQKIGLAYK